MTFANAFEIVDESTHETLVKEPDAVKNIVKETKKRDKSKNKSDKE